MFSVLVDHSPGDPVSIPVHDHPAVVLGGIEEVVEAAEAEFPERDRFPYQLAVVS